MESGCEYKTRCIRVGCRLADVPEYCAIYKLAKVEGLERAIEIIRDNITKFDPTMRELVNTILLNLPQPNKITCVFCEHSLIS